MSKTRESHGIADGPSWAEIASIQLRDGHVVPFAPNRIRNAILKAGYATGQFDWLMAETLTRRVLEQIVTRFRGNTPTVEQVQDIVEDVLIRSPFTRTAKAYIVYRSQHARIRELASRTNVGLMREYLDRDGWAVRENNNMAYSLQGLNNFVSNEVTEQYWLEEVYTPEIREAHRSGDFHIHDLRLLAPYCVGWDLMDLLRRGFRGVPGKVATEPAKHFGSALGQIVNFFYTLQGEAAGAQAFSHFDTLLAPFIRHDGLDYGQVKQALQSFVFNLNVPTPGGFSTPFTNLTFDLTPPAHLKDSGVVLGGLVKKETYGQYQREMNLLNAAFLDVLSEGDADSRVFTFPILTYNITPDFDWDNEAWSELWEVTAKYGIPYFANFIGSDMSPEETRSMCCRLRLDLEQIQRRGGGLFGSNPLTGSIGVVTINMPRIGYLAHDEEDFLARLDRLMELAGDSLELKRKILERFTENELYPYAKSYLSGVHDRSGAYWHNHFATIGLVGMNEACVNFLNRDIGSAAGQALAVRVLDHMRKRLADFQEATGHAYNLEATPAEGTSYRLARIDREKYPQIKTAADGDAEPFYTNSTQLPVGYTTDIFHALDLQDDLQSKYTGGTVQHVYLGEAAPDPEAVKAFVRKVCEKGRLPYLTITPTFSICPLHGYLRGEQPQCPQCKGSTEVYSRVVGYLRPVDQWNDGKQQTGRVQQTGHLSHRWRRQMIIGGFQPFSLSDFPGRVAAIVFAQGCNWRCSYCHNRSLLRRRRPAHELIPETHVLDVLRRRRNDLDGVVITGGEPTIQEDLPRFLRDVRRLGLAIKLDTNGSRPDVIRRLLDERLLDYVAMDIKAPFDRYASITGSAVDADALQTSIELLKSSGVSCEFGTPMAVI